ncbi:MAG: hypothetical protein KAQ85_07285, partial [Thermodesulfovibrionia bacterium]|nr:hypothetical protein [Thermodesulfovibrionia bacterium]
SGSWESLTPFGLYYTGSTAFEINGTATEIMIDVKGWLNNTLVDADDFEDGKNHLRHNVIVTIMGDMEADIFFSQQNFTYLSGTDSADPMFYYRYSVTIPLSPIGGLTYVAVVYYEIYWGALP